MPPGVVVRMGTSQLRHAGHVTAATFSPDGKLLVSGGNDMAIRVWETATGRPVHLLLGHKGYLTALAVSPDGRLLASGAAHETTRFRMWDLRTGKPLWSVRPAGKCVSAVAFAPDGKTVAAGDDRGGVLLLNSSTGAERGYLEGDEASFVRFLAFSPDGRSLVVCPTPGRPSVWEWADGKTRRILESKSLSESVRAADFSADGKTLRVVGTEYDPGATRRAAAEVCLFDATGGKLLRAARYSAEGVGVVAVTLSPDGRTGAASCTDGGLHLWDMATGRRLRVLEGKQLRPSEHDRLIFSPDGRVLALVSSPSGRAVRLWDVGSGKALPAAAGHEAEVCALAVSPNGGRIATGDVLGTVCVWDRAAGRPVRLLSVRSEVRSLAFSPDGRFLAAGGTGAARLWDGETGEVRHRLRTPGAFFSALAFTADGKSLVSAHGLTEDNGEPDPDLPGALRVWDVGTGRQRRGFRGMEVTARNRSPAPLAIRADDTLLALHADHVLRAWPLTGGEGRVVVHAAEEGVRLLSAALSPDGGLFAANLSTGQFRAWDVARGGRPVPVAIPDTFGQALAFSPDNRFLVTAGMRTDADATADERTIRLWELLSGKEVHRLPLPRGNAADCAAFLPDGRSLALAMADTTVLVWDLVPAGCDRRPDAAGLDRAWADLAGEPGAAYRAARLLAAFPEEAVPFLAARLRPVAPPDARRLARLIAELDDDTYPVRERADAELRRLGELAVPALHEALQKQPSLEAKRRMEQLLEKLGSSSPPPGAEVRRQVRGVAVLEWAATDAARRHLRTLADGAAGARLTREAAAALRRTTKRR